jgi:hypothetical protein
MVWPRLSRLLSEYVYPSFKLDRSAINAMMATG